MTDLAQRRQDAAVGRAIREAMAARPTQPRVHVSWMTPAGKSTGRWLSDEPLFHERERFAEAAGELYEAAADFAGEREA